MLKLPLERSIFARRVYFPSGNSPFFMRSKRSRDSAAGLSRHGLTAGFVTSPRYLENSSGVSSQT